MSPQRVATFALVSLPLVAAHTVNHSSDIKFLYGPAHSPPYLPVWVQILLLHLIALVVAIGCTFLRRCTVARLLDAVKPAPADDRNQAFRRPTTRGSQKDKENKSSGRPGTTKQSTDVPGFIKKDGGSANAPQVTGKVAKADAGKAGGRLPQPKK